MEFKQSKTYANLMAAFAGESQARNKYNMYADKARNQGYQQIGDFFDMTAHNERAHAKIWLQYLHDNTIPSTLENLKDGIQGEHYEWEEMYPQFAKEAREEGYEEIANAFEMVADIEKEHEARYQRLVSMVEGNIVFQRPTETIWICRNCGHVYRGTQAPNICPVCKHAQAFFEEKVGNL